jgi:hypothetical protein
VIDLLRTLSLPQSFTFVSDKLHWRKVGLILNKAHQADLNHFFR